MSDYPVLPVIMPKDLTGIQNGRLPDNLLRKINNKGRLHHNAATAWNALQLAAYFAGVELLPISDPDTYRDYPKQEALFYARYQQTPTDRQPQVTRTFNGKTWYLKKGIAPAGTPGSSNHGWGLAVDVANASGKRLEWLLANAVKYGFTWEVKNGANAEAWHIRFVCGDTFPQAVLDAVAAFPQLDAR